jgi:hypothetical protein
MRLNDLKQTDGVYVGVRPVGSSIHLLHDWILEQGIPNPVAAHAAHVTVLFSRAPVQVNVDRDRKYIAHGKSFQVMRHRFEKTDALVLELDSPSLQARHAELIRAGGSHDYPSYLAHVTLTTNVEEFDWSQLQVPEFPLVFGNEYARPLRIPDEEI